MAGKAKQNKKKNQAKDKKELKKKIEELGIPEGRIILHRMNAETNVAYRQALFRMHSIKELCVKLIRLEDAGYTQNGLSTIGLPTKQIGTNPVYQQQQHNHQQELTLCDQPNIEHSGENPEHQGKKLILHKDSVRSHVLWLPTTPRIMFGTFPPHSTL